MPAVRPMLSVENAREWRPPARWIVFVAVWVVWVGLAMGQLNDLLAAMHVSGSPSFTVSDVNSFFHAGPDRAQSTAVLVVWKAQAASAATGVPEAIRPATAEDVVTLFVLIDSVLFVPLYALLFLLFFRRAERGELTRVRRLARLGSYAILGTAFFDLVEDIGIGNVVARGWEVDLVQDPSSLDTWLWILWVGALLKWSLAGLTILLAILVGWEQLSDWREERRSRTRIAPTIRPGRLVGFQVVVVAAAIVLLNQEGQLADLYRRWQAVQLTLSLVSLTFAAFAVWVVTRRLLVRGPWKPDRTPERERRVARLAFAVIVALALAQFVAHVLLDDWLFDPGWGLVIPAGILAAVALLGWPIERPAAERDPAVPKAPPDARPSPQPQVERAESGNVLPRLLATALVVGFAIALLRASFGYAVYTRQWSWGHAAALLAAAALGAGLGIALRRFVPTKDTLARRVIREPVSWAVLGTLVGIWALAPNGGDTDIEPVLLITLSALLTVGGLRWYVAMGQEKLPSLDLNWALALPAAFIGVLVPAVIAVLRGPARPAAQRPGRRGSLRRGRGSGRRLHRLGRAVASAAACAALAARLPGDDLPARLVPRRRPPRPRRGLPRRAYPHRCATRRGTHRAAAARLLAHASRRCRRRATRRHPLTRPARNRPRRHQHGPSRSSSSRRPAAGFAPPTGRRPCSTAPSTRKPHPPRSRLRVHRRASAPRISRAATGSSR